MVGSRYTAFCQSSSTETQKHQIIVPNICTLILRCPQRLLVNRFFFPFPAGCTFLESVLQFLVVLSPLWPLSAAVTASFHFLNFAAPPMSALIGGGSFHVTTTRPAYLAGLISGFTTPCGKSAGSLLDLSSVAKRISHSLLFGRVVASKTPKIA